jgi:hypothetical protein
MWQAAGGPERVQGTAPQRSYYTLYLDDTHAGTIVSFPHTPHWMRACLATLQAPHTFIIMITRAASHLSSSPMSAIFILALCFYVCGYFFLYYFTSQKSASGAARLVILIMPACCVLFIVQENWMQNCKLRRGDARGKCALANSARRQSRNALVNALAELCFSDCQRCVFKECRARTHKSGFMAFLVCMSVASSKGHVVVGREKGARDTSDGFKIYRSYIVNVNPHKAPRQSHK